MRTDRAVRKRLRQIQRLPRGGQRAPRAPQDNREHQHDSRHRVAPRPPRHCRADRSPHPVTTPGAQAAGRRHLLSRVRGRSSSASKRRRSSLTVKVINVLAVVSASRSAAGVTTRKACSGMARVSSRRRRPHRRQPGPLGHAIDGSSDHLGGQRRFGGELNGVGNGPFGGGFGPHSTLSADTAANRSSCARLGSRTPNTLPLPNSRSAQRCHCTGVGPQSGGALLNTTGLIDNQDRLGVAQMINDMGPQIGHHPVGVPLGASQQMCNRVCNRARLEGRHARPASNSSCARNPRLAPPSTSSRIAQSLRPRKSRRDPVHKFIKVSTAPIQVCGCSTRPPRHPTAQVGAQISFNYSTKPQTSARWLGFEPKRDPSGLCRLRSVV